MKYLSKALSFTIKNWMLIIPLFALTALAGLIKGAGAVISLATIVSLFNIDNYSSVDALIKLIPAILTAVFGGSIISFIIPFIHQPATYGLVNKSLDTGYASLNDIGAAISGNFVKYIMYFIGTLVVNIVLGIATFLIMLLMILLVAALKGFGVVLMILVLIALLLFFIVFSVLTSFWFTAMVVDGLDVVNAFKKSIEVVKSSFWTVVGITLLVVIAASIISSILSFLNFIPVIGPIILSAIPTIQAFVLIVFRMMLYREKTGRDFI